MPGHPGRVPFITCGCGKRGYFCRRDARRLAKAAHPGDRLNAFPCESGSGYWHNGHLKPGDRDRDRGRKGIC